MKKFHLLGAVCVCLWSLSVSTSHAASVWSATLWDDFQYTWDLYVVTSAPDLTDGTQVTGVYLDWTAGGAIDPASLLTSTPIDLAQLSPSDWGSEFISSAVFNALTPDTFGIDFLAASGKQIISSEQGDMSCNDVSCTLSAIENPFVPDEQYQAINPEYSWDSITLSNVATSAVPLPAAIWLFGSGLIGLVGIARRKKA